MSDDPATPVPLGVAALDAGAVSVPVIPSPVPGPPPLREVAMAGAPMSARAREVLVLLGESRDE